MAFQRSFAGRCEEPPTDWLHKIVPSIFQHKAWDDSCFTTLREQSSARKFLETYPVDVLIMKGLAEAFKELGKIFMTKCDYFKWHRALETEVPQLADLNVVVLKPNVHRNVSAGEGVFLTDANAAKVISDAYKAGVRKEKLILQITPIARTYDQVAEKEGRFTGYYKAITEFGASPLGDGTILAPDGRLYYFFSKTRASCIVRVAKWHGLHGISLAGGYGDEQDFFPHDTRSLFSAIVGEVRSSIETR
ncbi:hypothetical protein FOL46_008457 [Perkinsus olseni]|uniref:Uncharacterized protein n=1 Tax=Perkinsus olseni TaxID=32597 RepID=A0A7J6MMA6_PEROL|nr:hypothetical protein FOL46_008457 [Perkinsus olseni]